MLFTCCYLGLHDVCTVWIATDYVSNFKYTQNYGFIGSIYYIGWSRMRFFIIIFESGQIFLGFAFYGVLLIWSKNKLRNFWLSLTSLDVKQLKYATKLIAFHMLLFRIACCMYSLDCNWLCAMLQIYTKLWVHWEHILHRLEWCNYLPETRFRRVSLELLCIRFWQ